MIDLLRFVTCGSVDDGKSTLIGRLLHDCAALFEDQLATLAADSKAVGTQGGAIDFALLVDGLAAEREQGITIDVAYRYFSTSRRRFIVADAPGHVEYTRNMVTGASTADAAVLIVDVRHGVAEQTRRHAWIAHLLGVRQMIVAVTKMDLVGHDAARFAEVEREIADVFAGLGRASGLVVPVSGLTGDQVARRGAGMPWYAGPTLIEALEAVPVEGAAAAERPLRLPVQMAVRPTPDFRGAAGMIASGRIAPGDEVVVLPWGAATRIAEMRIGDRLLNGVEAGQSVTVTLADAVACGRGDTIVAADALPEVADRFEATLVWLDAAPLLPGRAYRLQLASQSVTAWVQPPKYEISVTSRERLAAKTLGMNAIGVVEIATDTPIVFEPYADSRVMGGFILIDPATEATVACGMLHFALRRTHNLQWQAIDVTREAHAQAKGQRAAVIWLTGLSGSGKSTIANLVERKLHALGRHTFLLDGDNIRHGLSRDLGFTDADRVENIRRVGEVARLMADAGLIVIASFISPFRAERAMVRAMLPQGEFIEVFVDTPLAEAERRDPKGLYAKARAGQLANFTGIDSPYEAPEMPDVRIDTTAMSAEKAAEMVVALILDSFRDG